MSISAEALEAADLDALAAAGERWVAFTAQLAEQIEVLEDALRGRLSEDHWLGDAADAARERVRAEIDELEQRIGPARKAADAVGDASVALERCRCDLAELLVGDEDGPERDERVAAVLDRAAEIDQELAARIAQVAETGVTMPAGLLEGRDPAGALADLIDDGADPGAVNDLWEGLTGAERDGLVESRPDLVGSADGMPAEARDEANRQRLDGEIQNLDAEISQIQTRIDAAQRDGLPADEIDGLRGRLEDLSAKRSDLGALQDRVAAPDRVTRQDHYLLGYDSAGDGKAIVALGDPDTADHTAVFVPGTGAALGHHADLNRAATMAHDAHEAAPGEDTATVMWLGYDAPDHPVRDAPSLSYAKDGAGDLSRFMGGLDAANRDPAHANTTVVGYSYGSTVVGQAAKEHGLSTDQVVALASPGMNVGTAAELGMDPSNVWATTATGDAIHAANAVDVALPNGDYLGLGPSPTGDDFGARTFTSDAMSWNPLEIHGNYWNEGNAARDNIAYIVTGRPEQVT